MSLNWGGSDALALVTEADSEGHSTSWEPVGSTIADRSDHAFDVGGTGDRIASVDMNEGTAGTVEYRWNADSGLGTKLGQIKVGKVMNSFVIESIDLRTEATKRPVVAFTIHKHDDANHSDSDMTHYSLPAPIIAAIEGAYGAVDFIGAASAGGAVVSSSLKFSAGHQDVQDATGNHLWGDQRNGVIEASCNYNGLAGTADSGWLDVQKSDVTSATGFDTSSVSARQYVAQDT